ncbi:MAG: MmcQ/YjbR family DNA-binding protein [Lachnospiraceae bacterium]|nr:MmcQ/YjbR family DNA-binding protein [Lachnospiraceae bacterium]
MAGKRRAAAETDLRGWIETQIKDMYGAAPEYPWRNFPEYAVFRHGDNKKWFALVAVVPADKLGLPGDAPLPVINFKISDDVYRDVILREPGVLPAYHMNKRFWVTALLDGTVPQPQLLDMLDVSYAATASAKKKEQIRGPQEWIIPANPIYYDIEHAFDHATEIRWKRGKGIRVGDTVFMYVAKPVSAVLYECEVLEVGIPYERREGKLVVTELMRIRLKKRFDPQAFTFEKLRDEYGIFAVRGPRGIPYSLSAAFARYKEA